MSDVRLHHNYSGNIDWNVRSEFWDWRMGETLILRGRLGGGEELSTGLGLEYGQLLTWEVDIAAALDTRYGDHEGVWRVGSGVVRQVTKWWCVPRHLPGPRPTRIATISSGLLTGGLTERWVVSLLCVGQFVRELGIQISRPCVHCASKNAFDWSGNDDHDISTMGFFGRIL